ncbi:hypothetical protein MZK49_06895 [Ensifer sesbaniae]|uniref:hypothetical protein n=1 Tax=Ensifer sesbaniae TaxID=1214071 RepID=UPI002001281E|nr:hypothetical protein [Ensifer sesbaniae]
MVPEIIDDMRKAYQPFEKTGVHLPPDHVRVLLLMLAYLGTEWRNMESRLNGSGAVILLDPNSNVVPLKQPPPGFKPGGGAA